MVYFIISIVSPFKLRIIYLNVAFKKKKKRCDDELNDSQTKRQRCRFASMNCHKRVNKYSSIKCFVKTENKRFIITTNSTPSYFVQTAVEEKGSSEWSHFFSQKKKRIKLK